MTRGLENCKCAINIRAKVCLRLLNGWNDVCTRGQMEYALNVSAGQVDCSFVGNISFDDFQPWVAVMLLKVGAPANDKAVEDAHVPSLVDQPIDKVTSNKARAASYQIQRFSRQPSDVGLSAPPY
jgi:hypothetical protein